MSSSPVLSKKRLQMRVESVEAQTFPVGVVWKLGEEGASTCVVFVNRPWFKMTRSVSKSPRVGDYGSLKVNGRGLVRVRGILVTKVTDSWPACHEFESSAAEDPPCRGAMHVKSAESTNVFPLVWCGVVISRGGYQLRCRPRHLDQGSKGRDPPPKALV
ncbi:hypothetical protein TNCV_1692591 [Trichonephila clavipes]|nr:hypothetical protein TNCV_1692591 [Trichonephila clavipes]